MKNLNLTLAALLIAGSAAVYGQVAPPYTQDFYYSSDFNKMTVVDANADGTTWTYASYDPINWSPCARYIGSTENTANDWLITEALELKTGYAYEFSFKAIGAAGYTNNIDVMLGTSNTAEALTTKVMERVVLTEKVCNTYKATISVEADGTYYIGMLATADANQGAIYIDDVVVAAGIIANAPAAATDLVATPAIKDSKAVMNLSFTAPTATNSGAALDAISSITIYRGDALIATLEAATPGATVEYTDETAIVGNNSYRIICHNEAGEGAEAKVSSYISFSTPAAPTNVVLTSSEEGQTITWDAVLLGTSSSYLFIPENVTYTITRSDKVVIAEKISELTVTDNYTKEGEGQDLLSYTVVAVNEGGNSTGTVSNKVLIGNPYMGEYAESFANYSYNTKTWQVVDGTGTIWQTKTSSYYSPAISGPQDGDNGFVGFSNYTSGTTQRLVSPMLNVTELQNPRLSFYVYHATTTYTDKVIPEILIDGVYTPLHEGITVNGDPEGWTKYNFDLDKELVNKDFQLSFQGVAGGGYLVAIDNITIKDALADNLAVTAITTPTLFNIGQADNIIANIKNTGVNTAVDYTIDLFVNDELVETKEGVELASETSTDVVFSYKATPHMAEKELEFEVQINYATDLNAADNTAVVTVAVAGNLLPTPSNLSATHVDKSTIKIEWVAPIVPEVEEQPVQTEGFEEWTVDSTEPFGNWTFVDNDGANISGYAGFGSSVPMAFITSNSSSITPHGGSNYLVSPKNSSWRDYRDDWAISPEVVGGQTITFYVCQKGGYGYYGTTFYVCYSSTDNKPESFTAIGDAIVDKSSSWKEYSVTLPTDAKYFAIHVIDDGSSTSDAMAIDDITFQPGSVQLVHTGYNLYRNGILHNTIDNALTVEYFDTELEVELEYEYEYGVSALYETGESMLSNTAIVDKASDVASADIASKAVYAGSRSVTIVNCQGCVLSLYTIEGKLVEQKRICSNKETFIVNAGIYIATVDNINAKIVIR